MGYTALSQKLQRGKSLAMGEKMEQDTLLLCWEQQPTRTQERGCKDPNVVCVSQEIPGVGICFLGDNTA